MWSYLKSSVLFWVGVPLFIAGVVFLPIAISQAGEAKELKRDGVTTEATLFDKTETKVGKKTTRRIEFRFRDVEQKEHKHVRVDTGSSLWKQPVGTTVPLVYLRDNPGRAQLAADTGGNGGFIGAGALMVIGLACALPPISKARRRGAR